MFDRRRLFTKLLEHVFELLVLGLLLLQERRELSHSRVLLVYHWLLRHACTVDIRILRLGVDGLRVESRLRSGHRSLRRKSRGTWWSPLGRLLGVGAALD